MPVIRTSGSILRGHFAEPRMQTPDPSIIAAHFLRQIEANHVRTPTKGRPIPLQYNVFTQSLSEWAWPCNPDTEQRIPPSDLESFRRTHRFRPPSCFCAFLEGTRWLDSRIGIVETVTTDPLRNQSILNGEYVATCAKQRCGYFLCLERFYPLNHLRLQMCRERKRPLAPQELATITDIDKSLRSGDGLFQLMTDVVVQGSGRRLEQLHPESAKKAHDALARQLAEGMPEQRFWATFVQCFVCKAVTLRRNFAVSHDCEENDCRGISHPHHLSETPTPHSAGSRASEDYAASSPTPTQYTDFDEANEGDVFGGVDYILVDGEGGLSGGLAQNIGGQDIPDAVALEEPDIAAQSDDVPSVLSSDIELPTVVELLNGWRHRGQEGSA